MKTGFRHRARCSITWLCLAAAIGSTGCGGAPMEAPAPPMMDSMATMDPAPGAATEAATPGSMDAPMAAGHAPAAPSPPGPSPTPGTPAPPHADAGAASAHGAKEAQVDGRKGDVEQMLIFTGRLELMVAQKRFAPTLNEVIDVAAKRGGYIHEQTDQSVTVRVPSARFRETLRAFEELGEVTHRSVQAQDVSETYFDLGIRLKSLLATRDRLQGFLDRAKTIEEVLRVEQELRRLNAEIDKLEGQRRYLAAQAAYSTITVTLRAKPEPQVVVDDGDEQPPPPPPPPKTLVLPIEWFGDVSLDRLLQLEKE